MAWRLAVLLAPLLMVSLSGAFVAADHVDAAGATLYVAQTLDDARWDVGAVREQWLGRPFWAEPLTGRGVRVAIVDTGIDPDHPDLRGSVVAWNDLLYNRESPYDDDTHGTHVAGILGARGHFQPRLDQHYFPFGARGVAPGASLIVAKAMDREGDGDASHVAAAIHWALDPNGDGDPADGASVINLSIGLEVPPPPDGGPVTAPVTLPSFSTSSSSEVAKVRDAIQRAVRAGAVVIVAAGNHEPGAAADTVTFPGTMPEVITVGAVDDAGRPAAFSNAGTPGSGKPDLVAPGILLSTFPAARDTSDSQRDGYLALGGTSMAAPLVAGTVALMMEGDPALARLSFDEDLGWHTAEVRKSLVQTAKPLGAGAEHDPQVGAGRLQVHAAVDRLDAGNGPLNWDLLLVLAMFVVGIPMAIGLRRRRRERARRLVALRAEARAREAAEADGAATEPADRGPAEARDGDVSLWDSEPVPHAAGPEGPPTWQRPPWERQGTARSGAPDHAGEPGAATDR